jgi:hypothetical protein
MKENLFNYYFRSYDSEIKKLNSLKVKLERQRFEQIYREKALMSGGLRIGGDYEGGYRPKRRPRRVPRGGAKPTKGVRHRVGPKSHYAAGPDPKGTYIPGVGYKRGSVANQAAAASSCWISYVKDYQRKHGGTYKDAMINASAGYRQRYPVPGVYYCHDGRRYKKGHGPYPNY